MISYLSHSETKWSQPTKMYFNTLHYGSGKGNKLYLYLYLTRSIPTEEDTISESNYSESYLKSSENLLNVTF